LVKPSFALLWQLLRGKKPEYFNTEEFIKFCCVGVGNTLLDFGVYWFASGFLALQASRVISWVVAGIFSYVLNKKVFHSKSKGAGTALRFMAVNILSLLIGLAVMQFFIYCGFGRFPVYVFAEFVMVFSNYFGYKFWCFKKN
jgi:putative flippase GtrA